MIAFAFFGIRQWRQTAEYHAKREFLVTEAPMLLTHALAPHARSQKQRDRLAEATIARITLDTPQNDAGSDISDSAFLLMMLKNPRVAFLSLKERHKEKSSLSGMEKVT